MRDRVAALDFTKREARLASGERLAWDRLILSPGIELMRERVDGLQAAHAAGRVLQAWKAGLETAALRARLEAMPDGGVFVLTIPLAPFRCPPGPYERACLVADHFKRVKPKSKVLVFDANPEPVSKAALFRSVWANQYAGIVEYRPNFNAVAVAADGRSVEFELGERERADVLNVLPDMRAGEIAARSGLATAKDRWCEVDFLDFSAKGLPKSAGVHLLGDATWPTRMPGYRRPRRRRVTRRGGCTAWRRMPSALRPWAERGRAARRQRRVHRFRRPRRQTWSTWLAPVWPPAGTR